MKKILAYVFLISSSSSLFSLQLTIDINSWTNERGKVLQPTCMYSLPTSSSSCLTILDRRSYLWGPIESEENSYFKVRATIDNPNFRCGLLNAMENDDCFLDVDGWVPSSLYEIERYRDTCDYFVERTILLNKPDINCSGNFCEVSVNYSPVPRGIQVSAEIKKYDSNRRFLGREEEYENDYSPNGTTDVRFRIGDEVNEVIVSDVNCERR